MIGSDKTVSRENDFEFIKAAKRPGLKTPVPLLFSGYMVEPLRR